MLKKLLPCICLFSLFFLGCSLGQNREKDLSRIGVIDLEAVVTYFCSQDAEFKDWQLRSKKIEKNIALDNLSSEERLSLLKEKNKLEKKIFQKKKNLYNLIEEGTRRIVSRYELDFVLNKNENFIYGKKKYDYTEDVISEVQTILELQGGINL